MPRSFMRTLRLKVRREAYGWLNAAAVEVNEVFNYCNETSLKTATRTDKKRKWLSSFDLCNLTSGASPYFEKIGADTIQSVCTHYAQDAVGDWWLCLPVKVEVVESVAPYEAVGIDLGLKDIAVTSEGERLLAGRWTLSHAEKLASAQRRGHKRRAKRIHRKAARCRADALHKFSRSIVDRYQTIVVGDVSSSKLVKTRMANSVLDSSWGKLKGYLEYKSQQAARSFEAVSERNTSVTCSQCKSLTGPRGVNGLIVRSWICGDCGESHDRDVNAARSILNGSRGWTSVRGNEPSSWLIPPSRVYRVREAGIESAWAAA